MGEELIAKFSQRLEQLKNEGKKEEEVHLYYLRGLEYKNMRRNDEFLKDMNSGMKRCEKFLRKSRTKPDETKRDETKCDEAKLDETMWGKMKEFIHLQAQWYLEQGDFKKADALLFRLHGVDESKVCNDMDLMLINGKIEMMKKDYEFAEKCFHKAMKMAEKSGNESLLREANLLKEECSRAIEHNLKHGEGEKGNKKRGKVKQIDSNIGTGEKSIESDKKVADRRKNNVEDNVLLERNEVVTGTPSEICDAEKFEKEAVTSTPSEICDAEKFEKNFEDITHQFKYGICKDNHQYGVYDGFITRMAMNNDCFIEEKIFCSVLEVLDSDTAHYQNLVSDLLGEAAVKVIFVNNLHVVLEKIDLDFKSWYFSLYMEFKNQRDKSWWEFIQHHLKNLFRIIFKALPSLYPRYSHGNWVEGLAVTNGIGKLYNMKYKEKFYVDELKELMELIKLILCQSTPDAFDSLSHAWEQREQYICSVDLTYILDSFTDFLSKKRNILFSYAPFFWDHNRRARFLEGFYDIFWTEQRKLKKRTSTMALVENHFYSWWEWWHEIPTDGPLRAIYNFKFSEQDANDKYPEMGIYAVAFWRNCRFHYNESSNNIKTFEEIDNELNEKFHICQHVFVAVCDFVQTISNAHGCTADQKYLKERFPTLLELVGSFAISHI